METIVAIDIGTTHLKAILFSLSGSVLREKKAATPFSAQEPDKSEIDPLRVLAGVLGLLHEVVRDRHDRVAVLAVVVSGMASSVVPVNEAGDPLHACICWNDPRNADAADIAAQSAIRDRMQQYPMPMYLPFRIQWYRANRPDIAAAAHKWLNLTDFVAFHLSQEKRFVTDYSQASRTLLFDSYAKAWNPDLLHHFGIEPAVLPEPHPAGFAVGRLAGTCRSLDAAYERAMLILGAHDHMCALLGSGVDDPSTALNSTGTSEAIVFPYAGERPLSSGGQDFNLEHHIAVPSYALVGYVASTGSILEWANRMFDLFARERRLHAEGVGDYRPDARLPLFIPPGRRMHPRYSGGFIGLHPKHDKDDLVGSILEGLCFEAKYLLLQANHELGIRTRRLRLVGGIARAEFLLRLKSAVLGVPIEVIHDADVVSLGGFMLGARSLGRLPGGNQGTERLASGLSTSLIEPDAALGERLQERFLTYTVQRSAFDDQHFNRRG